MISKKRHIFLILRHPAFAAGLLLSLLTFSVSALGAETPTEQSNAEGAQSAKLPFKLTRQRPKPPANAANPDEIEEEDEENNGLPKEPEDPFATMEIKIAPRPIPPLAPCEHCGSNGRCPLEHSKKPYVLFESEEAPRSLISLGWTPCTDCARGKLVKPIYDAERPRVLKRRTFYLEHEKQTALSFVDFETRYFSGHFQTSPSEARNCGLLVERVCELIMAQCKNNSLLITSPATHHLIVCENRARYQKYVNWLARKSGAEDPEWLPLALKTASFGSRNEIVIRRDIVTPPNGAGLGNVAVFSFAQMLISEASNEKAPKWFMQGFANLCESLLFPTPRCYSIRYEENNLSFGEDWKVDVANGMRKGLARKWNTLFTLDQIGMSVLDYQLCWSAVRFLFQYDGPAFSKLPALFKKGLNSKDALEKAFGKSIEQLEKAYRVHAINPKR